MKPLFQILGERLGHSRMLKLLWLYPPYLGAGIRVTDIDEQLKHISVAMKLRAWNQNYLGTQFGGSLYSMVDPFFMMLVMLRIGQGYVVWDKSATIRFLKPGRAEVRARFEVSDAQLDEIRREVEAKGKAEPRFQVDITDVEGTPIAQVEKWVHVRRARE